MEGEQLRLFHLDEKLDPKYWEVPFVDEVQEFNDTFGKPNNYEPVIGEYLEWNFVYDFILDELEEYREASEKVAQLFSPNKCKIMNMEFKDANEYLKMGKREKFSQAWWNAQSYTPAGIVTYDDIVDDLWVEEPFKL